MTDSPYSKLAEELRAYSQINTVLVQNESGRIMVGGFSNTLDTIANALDLAERQRVVFEQMRAVLEGVEWGNTEHRTEAQCPACKTWFINMVGHKEGCTLSAALTAAKELT